MPEPPIRIELVTEPRQGILSLSHYEKPDLRFRQAADMHVVTAMILPDGITIENPLHSASINVLPVTGDPVEESITLDSAKAERLAKLFEELRPEHELECHDLVTVTEGWERDLGPVLTQRAVQPREFADVYEDVVTGAPYTVQILRGRSSRSGFAQTHSCLGTDEGRLLGLVGRGSVLSTMDADTTRRVYSYGARVSLLARTTLPPPAG